MEHAETKINCHESTIKNHMQHQPAEQALVFKLAAAAPLKRPYGNYGRHRVKAKKHKQPNTQSKLSATQAQGQRYEALAIDFLKAQGLLLLAKNLRCKVG
ncbi:hypothetical protein QP445_12130, partial [Micrococcus luteus]|nr:hypothetical protein [Micrococcus luteus]